MLFSPLMKHIRFFTYNDEKCVYAYNEETLLIFMLHTSQFTQILQANPSGSDAFERFLRLSTFKKCHLFLEILTSKYIFHHFID